MHYAYWIRPYLWAISRQRSFMTCRLVWVGMLGQHSNKRQRTEKNYMYRRCECLDVWECVGWRECIKKRAYQEFENRSCGKKKFNRLCRRPERIYTRVDGYIGTEWLKNVWMNCGNEKEMDERSVDTLPTLHKWDKAIMREFTIYTHPVQIISATSLFEFISPTFTGTPKWQYNFGYWHH